MRHGLGKTRAEGEVSTVAPAQDGPSAPVRSRPSASPRALVLLAAAVGVCVTVFVADQGAVQAALLGAGSGAMIASLALGVVVVYRGSAVVNIASGAMAMYAGYVFNSLQRDGELLVVAWRVDLGAPWPTTAAVAGALLISVLMSALYYLLIFGPLRTASPVARLVASVGLLLVLQSVILLQYGPLPQTVTAALPGGVLELPRGLLIPTSQVLIAVVLGAAAALLWALYRFTDFGLLTRAGAEDGRNLVLLGRSPLAVGIGNWAFSGLVISFFAIISTMIAGTIDPSTTTLLIVPALAAALLGRFSSFGWAAAGGLVIGMIQGVVQYLSTKDWYPTVAGLPLPGVQESVPLVLILLTLLLRRRTVGSRESLDLASLPFAPPSRHTRPKLLIGLVVGVAAFFLLDAAWRLATINTLIGMAICLSLVVLTGFVGQVSLAQMALAGFSGFVVANLSTKLGIGVPFGPLLGAVAAALLGVVVGYAALRVRGVHLAIVTLAAGLAIQSAVFENPAWSRQGTGAAVPSPEIGGWSIGPVDAAPFGDGKIPNPVFGIFCLVVVLLLCWLTSALRGSIWGRRMLAVRINEQSAAAVGVSVRQTKLLAFGVSGFIAGLAGALSAYRFGSVTPDYFGVFASLSFLAFAYMGGISSVSGAVVGGFLVTNGLMFTVLDRWLGVSPSYTLLIGGLGLILTVVTNPDGIAGSVQLLMRRRRPGRGSATTPVGPGITPAAHRAGQAHVGEQV